MASTFTLNKSIEQPASGSYSNAWAAPVNNDWAIIDTALGGVTNISVTGVGGPSVTLTLSQYQPPNIIFTGTLSANLIYQIPSGVGGLWSVYNNTTGAFTLDINSAGGGDGVILTQGQRAFVISDGTNVDLAQNVVTSFSQLLGQASNAQVPESAVQQWQFGLFIQCAQLIDGPIALGLIPAIPSSQITSGTIANARLPNVFAGPGVTIQSDPGTTPSGTFGDVFAYY